MALDGEILTVKEICEVLRVNQTTVYKLIREGRNPVLPDQLVNRGPVKSQ